jgi:DNA-binding winged helix-turn-helix (wHTH) protein/thioredoxin-like negative regulator of GroEL
MKVMLGRLTIDPDALVVALDGRPLAAAPKVVELILALGERRGDVLTKEALMERLWPQGYADDATLWQTVYLARKLLAKTGQATIETQPRRGYRLVCPEPEPSMEPMPMATPAPRRPWLPAFAAAAAVLVVASGIYTTAHRGVPSPMPSTTLRAYNLGRYYVHQGTLASVRRALPELQLVVREAPADARGYADLADAEVLFAQQTDRGRRQILAQAAAHANAALHIDPKSATAQAALAAAAFYASEPASKVDAAFKRALALDDGHAASHMYYGQFLLTRGDLHGAYAQLHRATDIDPSLGDANVLLAKVAYQLGDPHTAIRYAREGLGFGAPDKLDAFQTLGYAYVSVGQPKSALHAFRQLHDYVPEASAEGVAYVQSRMKATSL